MVPLALSPRPSARCWRATAAALLMPQDVAEEAEARMLVVGENRPWEVCSLAIFPSTPTVLLASAPGAQAPPPVEAPGASTRCALWQGGDRRWCRKGRVTWSNRAAVRAAETSAAPVLAAPVLAAQVQPVGWRRCRKALSALGAAPMLLEAQERLALEAAEAPEEQSASVPPARERLLPAFPTRLH